MPPKPITAINIKRNHQDFWFINSDFKTQDIGKYRQNIKIFLYNSRKSNLNESLLTLGIKIINFYHLLNEGKQKTLKDEYEEINEYILYQLEHQHPNRFRKILNDAENFFESQKLTCKFLEEFKEKLKVDNYRPIAKQLRNEIILSVALMAVLCIVTLYSAQLILFALTSTIITCRMIYKLVHTCNKKAELNELIRKLNIRNNVDIDQKNLSFAKLKLELEEQKKLPTIIEISKPVAVLPFTTIETKNIEKEKPLILPFIPEPVKVNSFPQIKRLSKSAEKTAEIIQKKIAEQLLREKSKEDKKNKILETQKKQAEKRETKAAQKQQQEESKKQQDLEIKGNLASEKWHCTTSVISLKCEETIKKLHECLLENNFFQTFNEIKLKGSFLYQFYLTTYQEGNLKVKDVDLEIILDLEKFKNYNDNELQTVVTQLFFQNQNCDKFQVWRNLKDSMTLENIQITFNDFDFSLPFEITFRDQKFAEPEKDWVCVFDSLRVIMTQDGYNIHSLSGDVNETIENIKIEFENSEYLININNPKIAKRIASYKTKGILDEDNIIHFVEHNITHKFIEKLINDLFKLGTLNEEHHAKLMQQYYLNQDENRRDSEAENKKDISKNSDIPPITTSRFFAKQLTNNHSADKAAII